MYRLGGRVSKKPGPDIDQTIVDLDPDNEYSQKLHRRLLLHRFWQSAANFWRGRGARAPWLLKLVGLGHLVERLDEEEPWDQTLSGGEKQRLAFARIFLHKPDIVVLDEATSALDPQSQDRLMALLTERLARTTVVSVGHRPELEAFHSRKIVLERRRGGAKFVTDIQLVRKPRGRLIKKWLRPRRQAT
jgi:ABC-type multidrug transport system ATPase subunit